MSKESRRLRALALGKDSRPVSSVIPISDLRVFGILGLLCLLLYAKALFFGFTYLDDNVLILDNLAFLQNIGNVGRAFTQEVFHVLHSSASYYRPILTLSFMFDALISGGAPFMYHFSNIVFHLFSAFLVYKLFLRLKHSQAVALLFSLIFSVHPVLTQAVAWVPGRNDSLVAIFALATFIFLIDYWADRNFKSFLKSLLFFALAIFTKETALVIPAIFGVYLLLTNGRAALSARKEPWWIAAGFAAAGLIWLWLRHAALGNNPLPLTALEMIKSVIINSPALIQFIGKVFFPFNLSVLPIMRDTSFGWGILALVGLAAMVATGLRKKSEGMVLFGTLWFLAFLLPSFIRPDTKLTADFIEHRVYLPIIGIFIILAETKMLSSLDFKKRAHLYLTLTLLCVFVVITFNYQGNFADRLSFWKNAASASPHSPLAQRNLGAMYYLNGQHDLAENYYKKSLALNPTEQMVHNNLGLIYASRGQLDAAFKEYQLELAINPNYDNAHFNLGLLYYKAGKPAEARSEWKRTLEINPDYSDAIAALKASEAWERGKQPAPAAGR
ncbi:MAG: tetratricopeptide repeat protein [Elusimicrobiota bacterium]